MDAVSTLLDELGLERYTAIFAENDVDLEALRLAMTVRLGSIVMVGVGVILAAIRLWA